MRSPDFTPGALPPAQSGGATPIRLPCAPHLALFTVEVCWPEHGEILCNERTVVARCHEEAAQIASGRESVANHRHLEVVDVQRRRRRPTKLEIEAWAKRMEMRP